MILRTRRGETVRITRINFGFSPEDTEFAEGYWDDSEVPLSDDELLELTEQNPDLIAEAWFSRKERIDLEDDDDAA